MEIKWEEGFKIAVRNENGATVLSANAAGLKSLGKIFLDLAEGGVGDHVHLDEGNSLEEGSGELVIEKDKS